MSKLTEFGKVVNHQYPTVSVLIITYNHVNYICDAIEGALKQKGNFYLEIVIGEDSSTDGTAEIVDYYHAKYPNIIKIVTSEFNVGMMNNLVRTLNACTGQYIAFCEGDDYWTDPLKLEKQVRILQKHSEYSICIHDVETIFQDVPKNIPFSIKWEQNTFTFTDAVINHFVPTLSIVVRSNCLRNLPDWFSESIVGDKPIVLIALLKGKGYYLHDNMGVKRKNPGGITSKRVNKHDNHVRFLKMYRNIHNYSGRKYKVLQKTIASLEWAVGMSRFRKVNLFNGCLLIFASIRHDNLIVIRKIVKKLFGNS